jgi:hypothetical protein
LAAGRHAEQRDHVHAVGVKRSGPAERAFERDVRGSPGRNRIELAHGAVEAVLVAHVADQLALSVLVARRAEMEAEAPVDDAQLGVRVALDGKPTQQHQPATVFELAPHLASERANRGI